MNAHKFRTYVVSLRRRHRRRHLGKTLGLAAKTGVALWETEALDLHAGHERKHSGAKMLQFRRQCRKDSDGRRGGHWESSAAEPVGEMACRARQKNPHTRTHTHLYSNQPGTTVQHHVHQQQ